MHHGWARPAHHYFQQVISKSQVDGGVNGRKKRSDEGGGGGGGWAKGVQRKLQVWGSENTITLPVKQTRLRRWRWMKGRHSRVLDGDDLQRSPRPAGVVRWGQGERQTSGEREIERDSQSQEEDVNILRDWLKRGMDKHVAQ